MQSSEFSRLNVRPAFLLEMKLMTTIMMAVDLSQTDLVSAG